jgi:hypothetical protein
MDDQPGQGLQANIVDPHSKVSTVACERSGLSLGREGVDASSAAQSLYGDFDEPADSGPSWRRRGYLIGIVLSLLLTAASLGILGSKLWTMYRLGANLTPTAAALADSSIHR